MLQVCESVEKTAISLLDKGFPLAKIILFSDHPEYPGYLDVQPLDEDSRGAFYTEHKDWMSRHLILNGLHLLERFVELLERTGYAVIFSPSTAPILADVARWNEPLEIEGYQLRPFQQFSMNQALERARKGANNSDRFYFWNWSAGAGKSYCSAAGAKALLGSGDVDIVIACTLSKLKENLRRNFESAGLKSVINDHAKPAVRQERYHDDVQVFVMNYEKLWVDEEALTGRLSGLRVLFVLDEGHKLIAESGQNKARKALDRLTRACEAVVWPMSATVVGGSPLRFRDVFSLDSYSRKNPLGSKEDFVARYADKVTTIPIKAKSGGFFSLTKYDWNLAKLHDVRHRVGERTCAVRKTDPGIREQFKGIECLPEWVPMTPELDILYGAITDLAREARDRGESRAPHYLAMRVASINPAALEFSDNEVAQQVWDEHQNLCKASSSNKIEMLNDRLESLQQAEEKAVVFCHWTELGILPLAKHIKVPYVLHYGTGQSNKESQKAQDRFKAEPDLTCFLSSDAGTHGLNFQVARYVISVDPLYSYDDLCQRNARIDRADSHLDGLTAYVMITEDSVVENRIWAVCEERRKLASAVQGTAEFLSYDVGNASPTLSESSNIDWLIGLED